MLIELGNSNDFTKAIEKGTVLVALRLLVWTMPYAWTSS